MKNKIHSYPLIIVDDEASFRTALGRRLGKRGLNSSQACGGQECLDFLELNPVSVVILDVNMPGMNGMDTLRRINKRYPKSQVILLTGAGFISDGVQGIKLGAFDYLTKPVEIDHLANKILQAGEMIRLESERQAQIEYRTKMEKKMVETERLASLGTLSTGVAHEINNPLAIINEAAGFMKQVLAGPEMEKIPRREALVKGIEKIESSVKRARKITHQLLGHVKKLDTMYSRVDLSQLIVSTLGLLSTEIRGKNIRVVWDPPMRPCVVRSDPYQIRQVLINLLDNAVHALDKDGIITLSLVESSDGVSLAIQDNGLGIPQENLGKIFDPFFSGKSFDQGTGLGLFVVHKILSGLGGDIDVRSRVGQGSCFTVRLPTQKDRIE